MIRELPRHPDYASRKNVRDGTYRLVRTLVDSLGEIRCTFGGAVGAAVEGFGRVIAVHCCWSSRNFGGIWYEASRYKVKIVA